MKVLFCHDGPLRKDEENNYYGTAHNDDTFKRYYDIGDDLNVIIRVQEITKEEAENQLSKITVFPFKVTQCPNISNVKGALLNKKRTEKIIEKEVKDSDYVVARLPSLIGFIAIDYAKKNNIPYLIELVACPWDAFWNHSLIGKVVAPIMYKKTKKRVKKAPYVVYVTNEFLQKRYPTRGASTSCSNVALTKFDNDTFKRRVDKISDMDKKVKIKIGTTAAMNVKYKGQQYIIEALGELKKRGINNFEYELVGGGSQSYLRSVARKHDVVEEVKFLGSKPHKEVFNWLETIDIYAQPSRQEGLPRALIEAMSKGLPAFGAKTAGIPELINRNFIFSNNSNNIKEICAILTSLNQQILMDQSAINYSESQKYSKELIGNRRRDFFLKFRG